MGLDKKLSNPRVLILVFHTIFCIILIIVYKFSGYEFKPKLFEVLSEAQIKKEKLQTGIKEFYSGNIIEKVESGRRISNYDYKVIFGDGSKAYLEVEYDEKNKNYKFRELDYIQ